MFLVMMNLLIAILSDIHAKVTEGQEKNGVRELNSFILELEVYFFWNRNKKDRKFLIWAEYDDDLGMSYKGKASMTSTKIQK